jgi:hypothetical protein
MAQNPSVTCVVFAFHRVCLGQICLSYVLLVHPPATTCKKTEGTTPLISNKVKPQTTNYASTQQTNSKPYKTHLREGLEQLSQGTLTNANSGALDRKADRTQHKWKYHTQVPLNATTPSI